MAELSEREDNLFNELFTRMRETEAQSQVLSTRLDSLCDRIESQASAIQTQQTSIDKFLLHLAKQEERSEKREQTFWKYIGILIGTVVALALGPKVANEILSAWTNGAGPQKVSCYMWWHNDGDRRYNPWLPMKENDQIS